LDIEIDNWMEMKEMSRKEKLYFWLGSDRGFMYLKALARVSRHLQIHYAVPHDIVRTKPFPHSFSFSKSSLGAVVDVMITKR